MYLCSKTAKYQKLLINFSVEEVLNFVQQALVPDDVMLLDVGLVLPILVVLQALFMCFKESKHRCFPWTF